MKPVILMRPSLAEENEFSIASKHLPTFRKRSDIPPGSLVVGRYSVVPFYLELEEDLAASGSKLINSYREHRWIADLREWYEDFKGITPKTWFDLVSLPENGGPFVLKGETNSRKFHWNTHMFAKNKREAMEVYSRLSQDSLIGQQNIYIREYVPLRKLAEGLNGLQVSEEYRFFFLDRKIVSGAFYWSSHVDDLTEVPKAANVPLEFLEEVKNRLGCNARFCVVDIARKADGDWTVIEVNDGQQSGLSENNPEELYLNLKKVLSFSEDST
jgi:hypothetical protein